MERSIHSFDRLLKVTINVVGPAVVLTVTGEIDRATRDVVAKPLFATIGEKPPGVVVDLTNVEYIGAVGLDLLAEAVRRAERSSTTMRIVVSKPVVLRPMEVTGLIQQLPVVRSLAEALGSVATTSH